MTEISTFVCAQAPEKVVIAFPIVITNVIPSSIFADLAQYDAILTGQNRAGMFFAVRNFANNL